MGDLMPKLWGFLDILDIDCNCQGFIHLKEDVPGTCFFCQATHSVEIRVAATDHSYSEI